MTSLSFALFGRDGFINPTPWPGPSKDLPHQQHGPAVWDFDHGVWRAKQSTHFDGGWRWYDSYDLNLDCFVIYNKRLHPQAHTLITAQELAERPVSAEFTLLCAKYRVLIEHQYQVSREWLAAMLEAEVKRLRQEFPRIIRGEEV